MMTDSPPPLVTVIVPTYNRAALVLAAIDSVLQQTYRSIEVLVIDDGSTDHTGELVGRERPTVRYVRTEHRGVAHARNVGTRLAQGLFVTCLDSDDLLYPYAVELLAGLLLRYPEAGLACAEVSGFDDAGYFDRYHLRTYHAPTFRDPSMTYDRIYGASTTLQQAGVLPDALIRADPEVRTRRVYLGNVFDAYLGQFIISQNTTMVRTAVARAAGDRNEALHFYEELDLLLRITRSHPVCFVDVPTYKLRYHDGQVSTTARPDGRQVWMRKQRELVRIVTRHAESDPGHYSRHRALITRRLAHLHRAAAVPMLLQDTSGIRARRFVRGARLHLARGCRYGHPSPGLAAVTLLPAVARRTGVQCLESLRLLPRALIRRLRRAA